jgi:hypothetical protein
MTSLAIYAFLTGAALGLRWRVLVLLPACLVFGTATLVTLLLQGSGLISGALWTFAVLAIVQVGYLMGSIGHGLVGHGAKRKPKAIAQRSALTGA